MRVAMQAFLRLTALQQGPTLRIRCQCQEPSIAKNCVCRCRRKLPEKVGDSLTAEQYAEAEELGILVDKDDQARPLACGVSSRGILCMELFIMYGSKCGFFSLYHSLYFASALEHESTGLDTSYMTGWRSVSGSSWAWLIEELRL